jgi:hypothetical protein
MQRVRIGLTGLASIFLLVMLAAVFTQPSEEEPITANSIEIERVEQGLPKAEPTPAPKEPLAELGVAPGNVETNTAEAPAGGPVEPLE